jgi:FAD synthase
VQVHYTLSDFPNWSFPVVTSGTFDGVHLGHQTIIARLKELSLKFEGQSVVITYHPHPRMVLQPENTELELLNTLPEKIARLEQLGVDHLLIIPFDNSFASLTSEDFIRKILVDVVHTRKLVIGYDHHFGKNREGSFDHLVEYGPKYGFDVEEIPAQDIDQVAVSSTKIREALKKGDIDAYVDYTGTIRDELLAGELPASSPVANNKSNDFQQVRAGLQKHQIHLSTPLGFNNTYALGMRETLAAKLNIKTISDLQKQPGLALGLSDEFVERKDQHGFDGV